LVDGAELPTAEELPPSIAELAGHNAVRLSWHEEVGGIGCQVARTERERAAREAAELAERERLDLTRGRGVSPSSWRSATAEASLNVAVRAIELSLERQGRPVRVAPTDLVRSIEELGGRSRAEGFLSADRWFEEPAASTGRVD